MSATAFTHLLLNRRSWVRIQRFAPGEPGIWWTHQGDLACSCGHTSLVEDNICDTRSLSEESPLWCIKSDNKETLAHLLELGIAHPDLEPDLLLVACQEGSMSCAELLLDDGFSPDRALRELQVCTERDMESLQGVDRATVAMLWSRRR